MKGWEFSFEKDKTVWFLIPTIGIGVTSYNYHVGAAFLCFTINICKLRYHGKA